MITSTSQSIFIVMLSLEGQSMKTKLAPVAIKSIIYLHILVMFGAAPTSSFLSTIDLLVLHTWSSKWYNDKITVANFNISFISTFHLLGVIVNL